MDVKVVTKIRIAATRSEVFTYLKDLKCHFLWNPFLRDIQPLTKLKQGMRYKTESTLLGVTVRGNNTVTKLVANRELQIENETGSLRYIVRYSVEPHAGGSEVVCHTQVRTQHTTFQFTAPVLRTLARRELQSDLKALKVAVEQKLAPAA